MDEYSVVPVEHQSDFENVSLVPVDHDPFGAEAYRSIRPPLSARPARAEYPQNDAIHL